MVDYKDKIITSVLYRSNSLEINFEKYDVPSSITINAIGECCSKSYFEYPEEDIPTGKKITDIDFGKTKLDGRPKEEDGYCCKYYLVTISFDDDSEYNIIMINKSNGYYSGWIDIC